MSTAIAVEGTVSFSIEGEFLTDTCRSLVTEGRWRHGLAILTEGLPGITVDQALSILRAEQRLTGVNTVELIPEDRVEVRQRHLNLIAWQYAGLWRRQGSSLWQPYAAVTMLGPGDLRHGKPISMRGAAPNRPDRITFYADSPADTWTRENPPGRIGLYGVLWRQVSDPPLWMKGSGDSAVALAEFNRLRGDLEERGGASREIELSEVEEAGDDDRGWPQIRIKEEPLAKRMAADMGLTGVMADALESIVDPEQGEPVPDSTLTAASGYILPDGTFYGCKYMQHKCLAERLLKYLFNVEVEDPQQEADRRNWLRIQESAFDRETVILSPKERPTKHQARTLVDWCLYHAVQYPEEYR